MTGYLRVVINLNSVLSHKVTGRPKFSMCPMMQIFPPTPMNGYAMY